jgi:hypothetical protein
MTDILSSYVFFRTIVVRTRHLRIQIQFPPLYEVPVLYLHTFYTDTGSWKRIQNKRGTMRTAKTKKKDGRFSLLVIGGQRERERERIDDKVLLAHLKLNSIH